jgi:hypothetical protein
VGLITFDGIDNLRRHIKDVGDAALKAYRRLRNKRLERKL